MEGGITARSIHFISTPGRGCQKEKGAEDRREGDQKTMIPPATGGTDDPNLSGLNPNKHKN